MAVVNVPEWMRGDTVLEFAAQMQDIVDKMKVVHMAELSGLNKTEVEKTLWGGVNTFTPSARRFWSMRRTDGRTMAQTAVDEGLLSPEFPYWDLEIDGKPLSTYAASLEMESDPSRTFWSEEVPTTGFPLSHEAAKRGLLPDEFPHWDIRDVTGRTASQAARDSLEGRDEPVLPMREALRHEPEPVREMERTPKERFHDLMTFCESMKLSSPVLNKRMDPYTTVSEEVRHFWETPVVDPQGNPKARVPELIPLAHLFAMEDVLPKNFPYWDVRDLLGETAAHRAARYDRLPQGFGRFPNMDRFDLATPEGWTVAHIMAERGTLPKDFDVWQLEDENGTSVAHVAAANGHLPPWFDMWYLSDRDGVTVAHELAAGTGEVPPGFRYWALIDSKGFTVAHEAARNGNLPDDFKDWHISLANGWTVAHEAVRQGMDIGRIPPDVQELKDLNGVSVRVLFEERAKSMHVEGGERV